VILTYIYTIIIQICYRIFSQHTFINYSDEMKGLTNVKKKSRLYPCLHGGSSRKRLELQRKSRRSFVTWDPRPRWLWNEKRCSADDETSWLAGASCVRVGCGRGVGPGCVRVPRGHLDRLPVPVKSRPGDIHDPLQFILGLNTHRQLYNNNIISISLSAFSGLHSNVFPRQSNWSR